MNECKQCRSHAINHNRHGRDGTDGDLCDVCYWRKRAESVRSFNPDWDRLDAAHESLREHMLLVKSHEIVLRECLLAFNAIPNKRIPDGKRGTTYKLAKKIEMELGML